MEDKDMRVTFGKTKRSVVRYVGSAVAFRTNIPLSSLIPMMHTFLPPNNSILELGRYAQGFPKNHHQNQAQSRTPRTRAAFVEELLRIHEDKINK